MVDPTSDHGEDVSEAEAPRCETCDNPIVYTRTHRVVTWIDDGSVQTVHFCDDECRTGWNGTRS